MTQTELYVCLIAAAVTILIRTLPFILTDLFHKNTDSPFLQRLNKMLTPALIGMLVIYCLKDIRFTPAELPTTIATALAIALCVITYIIKRNTLLSIVLPTFLYMLLIRVL